ncbi:hypothetical protein BUALT_Bualt15G0001100 [Buddleja alternifolia]|uniref:U-box domain-containing protein 12 n=1 Tax=Buddleja alternifolia TaxID=168488 RepID=A0AAV6WCT9_9LAMI|nr:hypothetical protein BUALT_Bualt15G0001100 [Buddleja alternifolia]
MEKRAILREWYDRVDSDQTGNITATQLKSAFAVGNLHFPISVVQQMIRMHDFDRNGTMSFEEFVQLNKFLLKVQQAFSGLERGRGFLVPDEAYEALVKIGFSLDSPAFYTVCELQTAEYDEKALESEAMMSRFHAVYDKLHQALNDIPYDKLGISEEVKEQVELMHKQLNRAKNRTETQDMELAMDMMVVFSRNEDDRSNADGAIIERLAKKLELHTMADLKTETMAVRRLVKDNKAKSHNTEQHIQQVVHLLAKFKEIAGIDENSVLDEPALLRCLQKSKSLLIPHEFLCPISLEIMTDPVIIATGQTYERESIQKWLNSGHNTCPKTGQKLNYLTVAPNFALRNLIQQWCEKNNYDLPKKEICDDPDIASSPLAEEISSLIHNLYSSDVNMQRDAIIRIRMLSKESPDSRILIANGGGIPPLVYLLSCTDFEIQQHIVTALLNLSLDEANKRLIAREGAIPAIIQVLQNGTQEAKENSAAALFSLSILDENKVLVGCSNGIPPLLQLLRTGTNRGKKDAATALFSLVLNQANRSRAIMGGIIPPLLHLLEDKSLDMVDEALSILLLIASHPEGRNEIGRLSFIQTLVEMVRDGTPKNKECATAVILELGSNNSSCLLAALQYGVYDHLIEITRSGTTRAQRKANSLLQLMSKNEHIPFVPRK